MELSQFLGFFFVTAVVSVKTPLLEDYYMAAVVEYHPTLGKDGNETLYANIERYISIISNASEYADIVVFPEAALLFGDRTIFLEVPFGNMEHYPNGGAILPEALQKLSDAAKLHEIYVAVNLHESYSSGNHTFHFNTNVVFDRNGTIVARYRKYNLFNEKFEFNITDLPEHITFHTDFGVTFGIFTCFDIIFEDPPLKLNTTDYIFLSWWFSELPFLTAVQQQSAWAYATDSNLLAAGGNNVDLGSSGSGIYAGRNGPLVYTQSNWNKTSLLIAKVFKKGKTGQSHTKIINIEQDKKSKSSLKMKTDDLHLYRSEILTPDFDEMSATIYRDSLNHALFNLTQDVFFEKKICQSDFCCFFSVNMTVQYSSMAYINMTGYADKDDGFGHFQYRVATFNGIRSFDGIATGGLQVCSIISCLNSSLISCGRPTKGAPLFKVSTNKFGEVYLFNTKFNNVIIKTVSLGSDFAEPSILESSIDGDNFGSLMNVSKFKFTHITSEAEVRFSSDSLGSAAIFGRKFSRDGSEVGISKANLQDYSIFVLASSLLFRAFFCKFL